MTNEVLSSLIGILASGAQGYSDTSSKIAADKTALSEAEKERQARKDLLNTELGARAKEGEANRSVEKDRILSEKEMQREKLAADADALSKELAQKHKEFLTADATERAKLRASIDESTARLKMMQRELDQKDRELSIDQAYKLGTGKLGTGSRLGGSGKTAESQLPDILQKLLSSRMAAAASVGKTFSAAEDAQYITELLKNPVIGASLGITQPAPPETPTTGFSSHTPTGAGFNAAAANTPDVPLSREDFSQALPNIAPSATEGVFNPILRDIGNLTGYLMTESYLAKGPKKIETNYSKKKKLAALR